MLGILPRMLVLSPGILFQLGSIIIGKSRKNIAFDLKISSTLLCTVVSPQVTACNEGEHFLVGTDTFNSGRWVAPVEDSITYASVLWRS